MVWDETLQLFKELTEAPGAPGFEGPVREILARRMAPLADRVYTDNLGSLVAEKRGTAASPKVMIAGHMDEVGFLVTRITDEGFLRFQPLGGWWSQVLLAQRVHVITRNGPIEGVIGSVPPHILPEEKRKKPVEIKDMFIDVGATSREEAESFGIRPGDPVVPICPFTVMKNEKLLMARRGGPRPAGAEGQGAPEYGVRRGDGAGRGGPARRPDERQPDRARCGVCGRRGHRRRHARREQGRGPGQAGRRSAGAHR
ncbi:hypothetical protein GCM10007043_00890 [Calditerricola satsumensis]|uniref:M42 family peptidase n=1 Tax=Calditerricola satsumensis TaxID=373054 RepID=A0A8J3B3N3_9BACI|nr:hypothetical protein GCM10007043_00890 [Calditerricola satsumensis]